MNRKLQYNQQNSFSFVDLFTRRRTFVQAVMSLAMGHLCCLSYRPSIIS